MPKIISWDVIISTPKELYAPILEALLENPPVDREHIAWMHESRRLMPTILYSKIPRIRNARYRRVMVFAVLSKQRASGQKENIGIVIDFF